MFKQGKSIWKQQNYHYKAASIDGLSGLFSLQATLVIRQGKDQMLPGWLIAGNVDGRRFAFVYLLHYFAEEDTSKLCW